MTFIDDTPVGINDPNAPPPRAGLARWDRWLLWLALLRTRSGVDSRTPARLGRSAKAIARHAGIAYEIQGDDPNVLRATISHAAAVRAGHSAEGKVRAGVPLARKEAIAAASEEEALVRLAELEPELEGLRASEHELEQQILQATAVLPDPEPEQEPPPSELLEEQDDAETGFVMSRLVTAPLVLLGTGLDAATTVPLAQHVAIGLPGVSLKINQLFPIGVGLTAASAIPLLAHRLGRLEFHAAGESAEPTWMRRDTALALYGPLAVLAVARGLTLGTGAHGSVTGALLGLALGLLVMLVARVAVREGFRSAGTAARIGRIAARRNQRDDARRRRQPKPTTMHLVLQQLERQRAEVRRELAALLRRADELRTIARRARDERLTARTGLVGLEAESRLEARRERALAFSTLAQLAAWRDAIVSRRLNRRPATFADPAEEAWAPSAEMPSFRVGDLTISWVPPAADGVCSEEGDDDDAV